MFRKARHKRTDAQLQPVAAASVAVVPSSPKSNAPNPLSAVEGDGIVLIGKGTRINGDITDCTLVEIQGILEGRVAAKAVIIRDGGGFKGELQAEHLEVHGIVEATVQVNGLLDVRKSGRISGAVTYKQLAVEVGAVIAGQLVTPENAPPPRIEQTLQFIPRSDGHLDGANGAFANGHTAAF